MLETAGPMNTTRPGQEKAATCAWPRSPAPFVSRETRETQLPAGDSSACHPEAQAQGKTKPA